MTLHYYNDIERHRMLWHEYLMDQGLIPRGVLDCQSVEDVDPELLKANHQCHFFAGIGGWYSACFSCF